MFLPKGDTIKKWGLILVGLAALGIIGYRAYQINYDNVVWCATHSRPCEISRLENTRDELIKIKELEPTKEVLEK